MNTEELIKEINPKNGHKFSPNLWKWMKKNRKRFFNLKVYLYSEEEINPHLYIGEMSESDTCLSGAKLAAVITRGSRQEVYCMPWGRSCFKQVPDFWEKYISIGRCAIDPAHFWTFANEKEAPRWSVSEDGKSRQCLWCGLEQVLEKYVYTENRTRWVAK